MIFGRFGRNECKVSFEISLVHVSTGCPKISIRNDKNNFLTPSAISFWDNLEVAANSKIKLSINTRFTSSYKFSY